MTARGVLVRLAELAAVLLIVSFGVFLMVALIPGDPATAILGEGKPPEQYEALRQELGLNDPILQRYFDWLGGALHGDLGTSILPPHTPVGERLLGALPVSLELASLALIIAIAVSIPLALWAAARQGGLVDRVIGASMFGLLSIPSFLAGLLLIMLLVNGQGWFPRSQWVRLSDSVAGNLHHAILPAIVIALSEIALFTRILRNDLVVTLQEDFVLSARAQGLATWRLLVGDALPPSSFSLVPLLGLSSGRLLGRPVIVEYLDALPDMGSVVVTGAQTGNFPIVQGAELLAAVIYVLVNSVVDLSYGILDPRTRRVHA